MKKSVKLLSSIFAFLLVGIIMMSGCSKGAGEKKEEGTAAVDPAAYATNPPATIKLVEEEEAEKPKKKTKKKKKKPVIKAPAKKDDVSDGDMMSYMRSKCEEYGCTGSDSPNFYKVLEDTAEAYGMTIAQAQAAWNAG